MKTSDTEMRKGESVGVEIESGDEKLRYNLIQVPPIPLMISAALQHVLMNLASGLSTSLIVSDVVCLPPDSPLRTRLFSSTMFMSGICTIAQTLLGLRLPVFQGPSSSFLPALLALQQNAEWSCSGFPVEASNTNISSSNITMSLHSNITHIPTRMSEVDRLQTISGSLMAASLLEILIGSTGLVGTLLRYIGPITVAPTISLIGLSLYKVAIIYSRSSWEVAFSGAIMVLIFTLYMSDSKLLLPSCGKKKKGSRPNLLRVFQLLPILLGILVMWGVCGILTVTDVFPDDPNSPRYSARTDAKASLFELTPWFILPYPGQFGMPRFSLAVFIGFCAAFCASMVESVGDYFAASKACEVDTPPNHAVNRGILTEGLGGLLSGAVGVGHATTSYSGNISAITVSKTASRSVMVCAGIILLLAAIIGKFGATLATIPDPALGSVLIILFGILVALGLSILRYVNLNSSRNLTILGVSLFVGIFLPEWLTVNPDFIKTGNTDADGVLKVVLGTPMFLGGVIAMILDNTVKGSLEDRGILKWRHSAADTKDDTPEAGGDNSGRLPPSVAYGWNCTQSLYKKFKCLSVLPFMPPAILKISEEEDKDFMTNEEIL